jgi:C_GCAxxG_C_C family probable redox protein
MFDSVCKFLEIPDNLSEEEAMLYHYNCAEAVLHAANEKYQLNLSEDTLNAIIPFGGGMSCRRTCGIISGGLATIGVMFGGQKPYDQTKVREIAKEYVDWFISTYGSCECPYIIMMKADPSPDIKCKPIIKQGCQQLEKIIAKYK